MEKRKLSRLAVQLAIPLAVGGLSALLSGSGMASYASLRQPAFAPPAWLFPVVWTILFLLMGVSAYLSFGSRAPQTSDGAAGSDPLVRARYLYAAQLFFNFGWTILFFRFGLRLFALFWLAALLVLILLMILSFRRLNRAAALLQIPYLLWVTFAGILNWAVYLLNG